MRTAYAPELPMSAALQRYFEVNQFGTDGGYASKWVDFKLGPLAMPFPNTAGRVRAVRYHDLHHILTDYDTNARGEFEISAWEIAAGCRGFLAAWQLNLGGMVSGMLSCPARTFRAFVRGRRSRSLYGLPYEPLLDEKVADVRRRMGVSAEAPPARALDVLLFIAALAAGIPVGLVTLALFLPLVPVGLVAMALVRKKPQPAPATDHGQSS